MRGFPVLLCVAASLAFSGCTMNLLKDKPDQRVTGQAQDYVTQYEGLRLHVDTGKSMAMTFFDEETWYLAGILRDLEDGAEVDLFGTRLAISNELNVTRVAEPQDLDKYRYAKMGATPAERAQYRSEWEDYVQRLHSTGRVTVDLKDKGAVPLPPSAPRTDPETADERREASLPTVPPPAS